ncbi:MAG: HAD-IA family hydrolase [Thiofilum sp.]|uniref:HAD family hydrolase n=1 Tax=Thiofilum sp. TaxID=2212733 RepID=UPI0025FBB709|nr:HAD-IA family hydrolase [Thiofilum sp.]MBK8455059.1 HAD-IA family hydrolase [Thiofilum sp.]
MNKAAYSLPQGVLFDLDGTLVDTAPDLVNALNAVLQVEGRETLTLAQARPAASHGAAALLKLGFGNDMSEEQLRNRTRLFLDHYSANICVDSELFAGMDLVLEHLEALGIPWGVVTNKPALLTLALLDELRLRERAYSVVSGDTLAVAKPHPEPLLYAASQCEVEPAHCIYIGDAERDIEAAKRAGMKALIAGYGYIGADDQPDTWGAQGVLQQPLDFMHWLTIQAAH